MFLRVFGFSSPAPNFAGLLPILEPLAPDFRHSFPNLVQCAMGFRRSAPSLEQSSGSLDTPALFLAPKIPVPEILLSLLEALVPLPEKPEKIVPLPERLSRRAGAMAPRPMLPSQAPLPSLRFLVSQSSLSSLLVAPPARNRGPHARLHTAWRIP